MTDQDRKIAPCVCGTHKIPVVRRLNIIGVQPARVYCPGCGRSFASPNGQEVIPLWSACMALLGTKEVAEKIRAGE